MCACALKDLMDQYLKKLVFWGFEIRNDLFAFKIFSIFHVFLNGYIVFLKSEMKSYTQCFKTKGLSPVR